MLSVLPSWQYNVPNFSYCHSVLLVFKLLLLLMCMCTSYVCSYIYCLMSYLFGVSVAGMVEMVEIPNAVEKFYEVVTRVREDDKTTHDVHIYLYFFHL